MQDRVAKAKEYTEEMIKIRKEIVDFHGEMVLLENYSALNYTGIMTFSFLSLLICKYLQFALVAFLIFLQYIQKRPAWLFSGSCEFVKGKYNVTKFFGDIQTRERTGLS